MGSTRLRQGELSFSLEMLGRRKNIISFPIIRLFDIRAEDCLLKRIDKLILPLMQNIFHVGVVLLTRPDMGISKSASTPMTPRFHLTPTNLFLYLYNQHNTTPYSLFKPMQ